MKKEKRPSKNTKKKYSEYEKTASEQLELFCLPVQYKPNYSNTIELYDQMPKYFHGKLGKVRTKEGLLPILKRDFLHRGKRINLKISPATLLQKDNSSKSFYPSQREELVEDALRKFVAEGRGEILDKQIAVKFTLYELHKELKNRGHGYDLNQIKESLDILAKTNIEITSEDEQTSFTSNMFETIGFVTEKNGGNRKYFVRFNTLVTNSVINKTWRLVNYDQCMQYKRIVSRWLHKRMSHLFLQATLEQPYWIKLSTIIRDSGMKKYKLISGSIRQVELCLKEMEKCKTIEKYRIEKIYSEKKKNKIIDAKFYIYVSDTFVSDIKKGHYLIKNNQLNLIEKGEEEGENINPQEKENEDNQIEKKSIIKALLSFNLSTTYINSILSSINTQEQIKELQQSICAGQEYIAQQEKMQNRTINPAPIIKKAIKEGWKTKGVYIESQNQKNEAEKQEKLKSCNLRKTKEGRAIADTLEKTFGKNIFYSWLKDLSIVSFEDEKVILSAPTGFIKDSIIKERYWDGVKKVEQGKEVWFRKGVVALVKEIYPEVKRVELKVDGE